MCGIGVIYGLKNPNQATSMVHQMNCIVAHRGLEYAGFYFLVYELLK
jgi:asparagine synthetase B (glutamine-hydrolysing)